jgi:hypothetical protein
MFLGLAVLDVTADREPNGRAGWMGRIHADEQQNPPIWIEEQHFRRRAFQSGHARTMAQEG